MGFNWGTTYPWTPSVAIKDCLPRNSALSHTGVGFGDFAELVRTRVFGGDVVVRILAGQLEDPQRGQRDGRLFDDPQHAAEFLLHLRTRARHAEFAAEERLIACVLTDCDFSAAAHACQNKTTVPDGDLRATVEAIVRNVIRAQS